MTPIRFPAGSLLLVVGCLSALPSSAPCAPTTPHEIGTARRWAAAKFDGSAADLPFSFTYGGKPSRELLGEWGFTRSVRGLAGQRTEHTLSYTDPESGLEARCVVIEYNDFPTVDWTLYFKNTGAADTPILGEIQALDTRLERGGESEFVLHHHAGATFNADELRPFDTPLPPGKRFRRAAPAGRSCESAFPYFNLQWQDRGVLVVIGWPGQWTCEFARDEAKALRIRAGQEATHFMLHRGEEVRTPRIVLQFWRGSRIQAQNTWRRWMLAYNVPRREGKLPPLFWSACTGGRYNNLQTMQSDERGEITFINRYLKEGIKPDYWWIDAGWYPSKSNNWTEVGTWKPDPKRYPNGLRRVADYVHAKGMKLIVWFEPERVAEGTWLYDNHPEWLLTHPDVSNHEKLLDMGNAEGRRWLINHVCKMLAQQRIDAYRQDFNCQPIYFWRRHDSPNRKGITEINYITGLLAYYDELLRRNPNLLIDNCSSGGCRNDIEMLRRAIPLWRSDIFNDAVGAQNIAYGLSSWLPYHGTGSQVTDRYTVISHLSTHYVAGWDVRSADIDYAQMRRLRKLHKQLARYWVGDYYPLTPYSQEKSVWIVWQFDRPDLGGGVVQAFRRADCAEESIRVKLHALNPDARYLLTTFDAPPPIEMTGLELTQDGLLISAKDRPRALLISYQRMALLR